MAILLMLGTSGAVNGRLERPTYAAGDRWVYVLLGSIDSFPGVNESDFGPIVLTLAGRVEMEVLGTVDAVVRNVSVRAIEVATRVAGSLSGSFPIPGMPGASASLTGTFNTTARDLWEDRGHLPVRTRSHTDYDAVVSFFLGIPVEIVTDLEASTSVGSDSVFPLDVGNATTIDMTTDLVAITTITVAGRTFVANNATTFTSTWRREVLSTEAVSSEAGTFATYKVNQSLSFFPGLAALGPLEAGNETAYYSNDVGSYVKRIAYVNGSPVAEMRLRSYVYAAAGSPSVFPALILAAAVGAGAAVAIGWLVTKRRRARRDSEGPTRLSDPDDRPAKPEEDRRAR